MNLHRLRTINFDRSISRKETNFEEKEQNDKRNIYYENDFSDKIKNNHEKIKCKKLFYGKKIKSKYKLQTLKKVHSNTTSEIFKKLAYRKTLSFDDLRKKLSHTNLIWSNQIKESLQSLSRKATFKTKIKRYAKKRNDSHSRDDNIKILFAAEKSKWNTKRNKQYFPAKYDHKPYFTNSSYEPFRLKKRIRLDSYQQRKVVRSKEYPFHRQKELRNRSDKLYCSFPEHHPLRALTFRDLTCTRIGAGCDCRDQLLQCNVVHFPQRTNINIWPNDTVIYRYKKKFNKDSACYCLCKDQEALDSPSCLRCLSKCGADAAKSTNNLARDSTRFKFLTKCSGDRTVTTYKPIPISLCLKCLTKSGRDLRFLSNKYIHIASCSKVATKFKRNVPQLINIPLKSSRSKCLTKSRTNAATSINEAIHAALCLKCQAKSTKSMTTIEPLQDFLCSKCYMKSYGKSINKHLKAASCVKYPTASRGDKGMSASISVSKPAKNASRSKLLTRSRRDTAISRNESVQSKLFLRTKNNNGTANKDLDFKGCLKKPQEKLTNRNKIFQIISPYNKAFNFKYLSMGKNILLYMLFGLIFLVWSPCIVVVALSWLVTYPLRPHHIITDDRTKTWHVHGSLSKCNNKEIRSKRNVSFSIVNFITRMLDFMFSSCKRLISIVGKKTQPKKSPQMTSTCHFYYRDKLPNPKRTYTLFYTNKKGWVMKPVRSQSTNEHNRFSQIFHNLRCKVKCDNKNLSGDITNRLADSLTCSLSNKMSTFKIQKQDKCRCSCCLSETGNHFDKNATLQKPMKKKLILESSSHHLATLSDHEYKTAQNENSDEKYMEQTIKHDRVMVKRTKLSSPFSSAIKSVCKASKKEHKNVNGDMSEEKNIQLICKRDRPNSEIDRKPAKVKMFNIAQGNDVQPSTIRDVGTFKRVSTPAKGEMAEKNYIQPITKLDLSPVKCDRKANRTIILGEEHVQPDTYHRRVSIKCDCKFAKADIADEENVQLVTKRDRAAVKRDRKTAKHKFSGDDYIRPVTKPSATPKPIEKEYISRARKDAEDIINSEFFCRSAVKSKIINNEYVKSISQCDPSAEKPDKRGYPCAKCDQLASELTYSIRNRSSSNRGRKMFKRSRSVDYDQSHSKFAFLGSRSHSVPKSGQLNSINKRGRSTIKYVVSRNPHFKDLRSVPKSSKNDKSKQMFNPCTVSYTKNMFEVRKYNLSFRQKLCRCCKAIGCKAKDTFNRADEDLWPTDVNCGDMYLLTLKRRPWFWVHNLCPSAYPFFLYCYYSTLNIFNMFLFFSAMCIWFPIICWCYVCYALFFQCFQ